MIQQLRRIENYFREIHERATPMRVDSCHVCNASLKLPNAEYQVKSGVFLLAGFGVFCLVGQETLGLIFGVALFLYVVSIAGWNEALIEKHNLRIRNMREEQRKRE